MKFSARKIRQPDITFISDVYEQNRAVLHGCPISLDEWTRYFKNTDISGGWDPYESHHILTVDNTPAAWLKINAWNEPEICISMLVVDDQFKRKGVGRFALRFTEKRGRYWAKSAVRIQTTKDNSAAAECYLNSGFELIREMTYKVGDGAEREGYEFKKTILPAALTENTLKKVLRKMFGVKITGAEYQTSQMRGGTVGDIRLVTGTAVSADGDKIPFKVVLKVQKKWRRPGDPNSWRREYDLYASDFATQFNDALLRRPVCYLAKMNGAENETQIWMEYIDGVSGENLSVEMLERAALELGRFQGGIYARPELLNKIMCLNDTGAMERAFGQWTPETVEYQYLRYDLENVSEHNRKFIHSDKNEIPERLREMLIDAQRRADEIFAEIGRLPVVLCHRDFWVENIFFTDDKLLALIDWDGAGFGYAGEDIASLIVDGTDHARWHEFYVRFISAWRRGLAEHMDISSINSFYIREMIIINFGYRILQEHMFAETDSQRKQAIEKLQSIYEMRYLRI